MYCVDNSELLKAFNQGNSIEISLFILPFLLLSLSYSINIYEAHSVGQALCQIPGIQWRKRDITINQLYLIDIYRITHPTAAEYTFFSSSHGMFDKIDHSLGHKTYLTKFRRINVIQSRLQNTMGLNQILKTERQLEIPKYLKTK